MFCDADLYKFPFLTTASCGRSQIVRGAGLDREHAVLGSTLSSLAPLMMIHTGETCIFVKQAGGIVVSDTVFMEGK